MYAATSLACGAAFRAGVARELLRCVYRPSFPFCGCPLRLSPCAAARSLRLSAVSRAPAGTFAFGTVVAVSSGLGGNLPSVTARNGSVTVEVRTPPWSAFWPCELAARWLSAFLGLGGRRSCSVLRTPSAGTPAPSSLAGAPCPTPGILVFGIVAACVRAARWLSS
jgi:hypothetical protein